MKISQIHLAVSLACIALCAGVVNAAPVITGVSGTPAHGSQLTLSGTGFGVKSPAKPYLWAPMDTSSAPSALGTVTAWEKVESFTYNASCGVSGGGCLAGNPSNGVASNDWGASIVAPAGSDWNAYGRKTYVYRKSKKSFDYDETKNVKIFRFWNTTSVQYLAYPDFYMSLSNGRIGVEGIPTPSQDYTMDLPTRQKAKGPVNQWYTEELSFKSNSSSAAADADFRLAVNGGPDLVSFPNTSWMLNSFKLKTDSGYDNDGRMVIFYPIHMVVEGTDGWVPTAAGSQYWVDDVYVDNTWARVMIGDTPTFSAATVREIQIPYQWADGSVSVNVNTKAFPAGKTMYAYVVDQNGMASPGFPLTTAIRPNAPDSLTVQ